MRRALGAHALQVGWEAETSWQAPAPAFLAWGRKNMAAKGGPVEGDPPVLLCLPHMPLPFALVCGFGAIWETP